MLGFIFVLSQLIGRMIFRLLMVGALTGASLYGAMELAAQSLDRGLVSIEAVQRSLTEDPKKRDF